MARHPIVTLLAREIRELYPGYFALVMATGIVSIAAHLLGATALGKALLYTTIAAYIVLSGLLIARLLFFFPRVVQDLKDHAKGPGYFTVVAGTCVLGRQLILLADADHAGSVLWMVGACLWFVLMYGMFTAAAVVERKPSLTAGINGSWLIAVVATQSVTLLGVRVAALLGPWSDTVFFFTLLLYMAGCFLYLLIITLIFYRLTFFDLAADALTPPYWINMGAVAITTLAGTTLLIEAAAWPLLAELSEFVLGVSLLSWAAATWWIPVLLLLGAWRHLVRQVPLRYDAQYWGMVFPLGMYAAATFQLSRATGTPFLLPVARLALYAGVFAWTLAMLGLLHRLVRLARPIASPHQPGPDDARTTVRTHGLPEGFPLDLHVLCPLHGVEADVRLVLSRAGARVLAGCSVLPHDNGSRTVPLRCGGRCVVGLSDEAMRTGWTVH